MVALCLSCRMADTVIKKHLKKEDMEIKKASKVWAIMFIIAWVVMKAVDHDIYFQFISVKSDYLLMKVFFVLFLISLVVYLFNIKNDE